jgi:Holliday junction resolvasome RuvABC endonuclease subunit
MRPTLALDLGTTTGYAFRSASGAIISGVWTLKPGRFEGGGMRYLRFENFLKELHGSSPIGAIYFEEVRRHKGTDAAHVYGGLMGVLTKWAESNCVPYEGVPVGEIKKSWTGNGAAPKQMMIARAVAKGFQPVDDNESDALALLHLKMEG